MELVSPPIVHEIFVSGHQVSCTCGVNKRFESYSYARRFAEKHALGNRPSLIRPFNNN